MDGLRSHVSEIVVPSAPSEKFDFFQQGASASASSPSQPPSVASLPFVDGQGSAVPIAMVHALPDEMNNEKLPLVHTKGHRVRPYE